MQWSWFLRVLSGFCHDLTGISFTQKKPKENSCFIGKCLQSGGRSALSTMADNLNFLVWKHKIYPVLLSKLCGKTKASYLALFSYKYFNRKPKGARRAGGRGAQLFWNKALLGLWMHGGGSDTPLQCVFLLQREQNRTITSWKRCKGPSERALLGNRWGKGKLG